jgi:hypothetical protein
MKVAICVSGLPRFSRSTTQLIKDVEDQFQNYEVDWFFHLWNPAEPDPYIHNSWTELNVINTEKRLRTRLPKHHNLSGLEVEKFNGEFLDTSLMLKPNGAPLFLSQYRVDQMRQNKEKDQNFLYDFVVRLRPDVTFEGIMPTKIPKDNVLVVHIESWDSTGQICCIGDTFAAGGSEEMTRYSSLITCYQNYRPYFIDPPIHNEIILACHFSVQGLIPYKDPNFTVHLRLNNAINESRSFYQVDYTGWEN